MEPLNKRLNENTRGWAEFLNSDEDSYNRVCGELKKLTSFADITLLSAHKMCEHLNINGKKFNVNEFTKFFDNDTI